MRNPKEITLLVVDDDADMREVIAHDFRKKGFNILMASGGNEAIKIMGLHKVDLVLTDVQMPNGNGIELFNKIKEEIYPIPDVIFITGCSSDVTEKLINMGAINIFPKPFDRQKIFDKVLKILK